MKTLYLMRHAKSSWKDLALDDRDRPLNARGRRDAPEMGHRLAARGPLPQRLLCSPARRARDTARAVAEGAGLHGVGCISDERLYFNGVEGWIDTLRSLEDSLDVVLLVGHNPDFSAVVCGLGGLPVQDFPTASLARFALTTQWSDLRPETLQLIDLDWPKKG